MRPDDASLGRFLGGRPPARANAAPWVLSRRPADAPADAPWEVVQSAAAHADAAAELTAPSGALRPLDVARLARDPGRRSHWFVRDDGGPAARLPDLTTMLVDAPGESRRLVAELDVAELGEDNWPDVWHRAPAPAGLLLLLGRGGAGPALLVSLCADLLEAALAAARAAGEVGPATAAAVRGLLASARAWRPTPGTGPLAWADPAATTAVEPAAAGREILRASLVLEDLTAPGLAPEAATEAAADVGRILTRRDREPGARGALGRAAAADLVRARVPLGAALLLATDPGRFLAAHRLRLHALLGPWAGTDIRVRVFYGDVWTGEDDLATAAVSGGVDNPDGTPEGWRLWRDWGDLAPAAAPLPLDRVVRLLAGSRNLTERFRVPDYHLPPFETRGNTVWVRGERRASLASAAALRRWIDFVRGGRHTL